MRIKKKLLSVPACITLVSVALGCGFMYSHKVMEYEALVIQPFPDQVDAMFSTNTVKHEKNRYLYMLDGRRRETLKAGLKDLKLADPKLDAATLNSYEKIRTEMLSGMYFFSDDERQKQVNKWTDDKVLKALPEEFSLYLKGALLYKRGHTAGAVEQWEAILELPKDKRKYRSVWAAWMLARTSKEKGKPIEWYNKIEEMVKDGMPDSLGLMDNKEDWKIYFGYKGGDYLPAIKHYIKQGKTNVISGEEARVAVRTVLHLAIKEKGFLEKAAVDKDIRYAVTCYVDWDSYVYDFHKFDEIAEVDQKKIGLVKQWIEIMERQTDDDLSKELSTLSATAYKLKDFKLAERLLKKVTEQRPSSLWIRAKLASYRGDLEGSSKLYKELMPLLVAECGMKTKEEIEKGRLLGSFDQYEGSYSMGKDKRSLTSLAYAEYAAIELGLKRYGHALDLFILAGSNDDAGYIAETVMSPEELLEHMKISEIAQGEGWLRGLLARKLARYEHFKEAREYLPEKDHKQLDEYVKLYSYAVNEKNPVKKRVESFQKAASIRSNEEMFGYADGARPSLRIYTAGMKYAKVYDHHNASDNLYPVMSEDEKARVRKYYRRYGKVSIPNMDAALLEYRAAMLLPENDDEAAALLNEIGFETRLDPEFADKFYKTLVLKFGKTDIGKYADKRRWFSRPSTDFKARLKELEEKEKEEASEEE